MLMSADVRNRIMEALFETGVLTARKDFRPTCQHKTVKVLNLYVVKAMQSLKSRGYVTELFVWQTYHWVITNEGISFVRDFLNLPAEVVPAIKKAPIRSGNPMAGGAFRTGPRPAAPGAAEVPKDTPAGQVEFRGGMGRGKAI